MIIEALKASFDKIVTRKIDLPWFGPEGQLWRMEIYSHDRPEYQAALLALEINPRGIKDRRPADGDFNAAMMREIQRQQQPGSQGANGTKDEDPERLAQECKEIRAFDFPRAYPRVGYSRAETDKARKAVLDHLVVRCWEVTYCQEEREITRKELGATFANEEVLPEVILVARAGVEKEEHVVFANEKEGVAFTAAVLREAVLRHKFKERLVPLSSASETAGDRKATTKARPDSPPPSPPASQPGSGVAQIETAQT